MSKRWNSKKEVLRDLAIATGKRVGDISEDYVVQGERPPPSQHVAEEDDEMLIRLRGGNLSSVPEEMVKPDLIGITNMLRMVDEFYDVPLNVGSKDVKNKNETITSFSISKLNPRVAEFIPKSKHISDSLNNLDNVCISNAKHVQDINKPVQRDKQSSEKLAQLKRSNENDETDSFSNKPRGVDTSKLTATEMQEMRDMLKIKISRTSNKDCVKAKRERNVAIATLLKLHCEPQIITNANERDEPKLIAPDFYEKSLSEHRKDAGEIVPNLNEDKTKTNISTIDYAINKNLESLVNKNTSSPGPMETETISDNNVSECSRISNRNDQKEKSPTNVKSNSEMTKEIKDSIEKVETWLNSPKKKATKGPSLYLGPVTFKRKVSNKPMSPISNSTDSENNVIQKLRTDSFVPSQLANELTKKYTERSKAMEVVKQDLWTQLESELKAKDEIIKKQRLQASSSSLDSADSTELSK